MKMKKNKEIRLYNIILPIWLLLFLPSWLWLLVIPANYGIDYLVTRWSMKHLKIASYKEKALKHSWKICLAGFVSDFVGALFLFAVLLILDTSVFRKAGNTIDMIYRGLMWNPFEDLIGFLIIVLSIVIAGISIYLLDSYVLKKDTDLDASRAKRIALHLAILTAPYLYLLPSSLIY